MFYQIAWLNPPIQPLCPPPPLGIFPHIIPFLFLRSSTDTEHWTRWEDFEIGYQAIQASAWWEGFTQLLLLLVRICVNWLSSTLFKLPCEMKKFDRPFSWTLDGILFSRGLSVGSFFAKVCSDQQTKAKQGGKYDFFETFQLFQVFLSWIISLMSS